MTSAQRQQLKKALEKLKKDLTTRAARRPEKAEHEEREVGAEEDIQPLEEMNAVIASTRNKTDSVLFERVNAALKRLKDDPDDFGNCQECGDEIPLARLKAMPYAEFCVDCQQKKDPPRGVVRKNLTDYVE
ncbi:MAG: TraR/DksA C4-type zinc finger protein [Myxococcaceae bacterium]